ncbi:hypothetical protein O181_019207 [Austropuccinia psidii MF-1]|uniref:Protein SQS1 n=1 Tax=Austropuccinia psidii MF-1 TaxID=1389203 RepID=A0A9Q3CB34_9BASI|nr:hypothetical protein [Austropuccinia psidii MF-1]
MFRRQYRLYPNSGELQHKAMGRGSGKQRHPHLPHRPWFRHRGSGRVSVGDGDDGRIERNEWSQSNNALLQPPSHHLGPFNSFSSPASPSRGFRDSRRGSWGSRSGFSTPSRGSDTKRPNCLQNFVHDFHSSNSSRSNTRNSIPSHLKGKSSARRKSNPRFLVPVKFVRATSLTDKALEKLSSKDSESTESATNRQVLPTPYQPSFGLSNLTSSAEKSLLEDPPNFNHGFHFEMEELSSEATQSWQDQFPGLTINHSFPSISLQQADSSILQVGITNQLPLDFSKQDLVHQPISKVSSDILRLPGMDVLEESKAMKISDLSVTVESSAASLSFDKSINSQRAMNQLAIEKQALITTHSTTQTSMPCDTNNLDELNLASSLPSAPALGNERTCEGSGISPVNCFRKDTSAVIGNKQGDPSTLSISGPSPCSTSTSITNVEPTVVFLDSLYFDDSAGDFSVLHQNACLVQDTQKKNPSVFLGQETDVEEDHIVFQPRESNSPSDEVHLERTIRDPVNLSSRQLQEVIVPQVSKEMLKAPAQSQQESGHQKNHPDFCRLDCRPPAFVHEEELSETEMSDRSDINWGSTSRERAHLSKLSGIKGSLSARKARKRAWKQHEEMEILADYMMHTVMDDVDSNDESKKQASTSNTSTKSLNPKLLTENSFMETFLKGMEAHNKGQIAINELEELEQAMVDDEELDQGGWNTNSMCSLDSDGDDDQAEQTSNACKSHSVRKVRLLPASANKSKENILGESMLALAGKLQLNSDDESPPDHSDTPACLAKEIVGKNKKGKSKKTKMRFVEESNDMSIEFIDELQDQWETDRAKKAQQKKERAENRLLSPPKTKKQRKKATKQMEADGKEFDFSIWDSKIRDFINLHPELTHYDLPPMKKKIRARIHLLANVYGLKSHSLGEGTARYTVLQRTHRTSSTNINKKKLKDILSTPRWQRCMEEGRNPNKSNHSDEKIKNRRICKKTREGMPIGKDVKHIGEENIGFKLLSKMGWSMGQTIGNPHNNSTALQYPLMAVWKSTKGGLGLNA